MVKRLSSTQAGLVSLLGAIIVITGILFTLYGALLRADFLFKDDWSLVPVVGDTVLHPQIAGADIFDSFWHYGVEHEIQIGRFRPVYWAVFSAEAHLFHNEPRLWYLETLIIGVLSCTLFFAALRTIGLGWIPSMVGTLAIILPGQRLWIELQLAEEPAFLFAMFTLLAWAKGAKSGRAAWDWLGLASLILAGLCKETFALLVVPLALMRVGLDALWFHHRSLTAVLQTRKWFASATAISFTILIAIAGWLYLKGGYGADVVGDYPALQRLSPLRWLDMLLPWRLYLAYFVPALGILLYLPLLRSSRTKQWRAAGIVAFLAAWAIPQFVLYADISFANSYYFFPAVTAFALLNAIGMQAIKTRLRRPLYAAVSIFVLFTLIYRAPMAISFVNRQVAYTRANMALVRETQDALSGTDGTLLLVTEAWASVPLSFVAFLSEEPLTNPIYWQPINTGNRDPDEYQSEIQLITNNWTPLADGVPGDQVEVIAAALPAADYAAMAYDWFDPAAWQTVEIVEPYRFIDIGLRPPRLNEQDLAYRYALFVRR